MRQSLERRLRRAADTLEPTDPIGAATLRRASTHWLRHAAASHQADAGTDIRFIQKNLRHASIETTGIYLHAEDDRRHAQTTQAGSEPESVAVPAGNLPA
ncbi:tyrosine-type recombinase/integrase [Cupriavidus sp. D39]|uniref:tyrosine-type recombinase/integrase n=1 Tax=Cupriavidus sp. D39 TaxID=2997877 RepID=UPI00226EF807|nr:tyrosine-type recombinase/integrase [Cupriavidus sp. D39]MCY0853528.1 tyrosine-type recombinase/integrase [Cupriavidus sp. D39]